MRTLLTTFPEIDRVSRPDAETDVALGEELEMLEHETVERARLSR